MGQAHSKCLPLDLWIQDTLPPLLHPTLSHQPCLPASLTPSSPVDQGSRQAGDSLLLFWAGFFPHALAPSHPRGGGGRAARGTCEPLHGCRLGPAAEQEGQLLGHQGEDTGIACSSAEPPLQHTLPVRTHTWQQQHILPCSGSTFPREPQWPSGRRGGHTGYH